MIRIILIMVVAMMSLCDVAMAQLKMREVFAKLPQEVLPLMTKNNRLDCIDFIENNMKASVRNVLDEYVTLDELDDIHLKLTTSESGYIEMMLLPYDTTQIIALVRTSVIGIAYDSSIEFYTTDWHKLQTKDFFAMPELDDFFREKPSTDDQRQAYQELNDYHPISISMSPEELWLECALQNYDIETRKRASLADILGTVVLRWDGSRFVHFIP